MPQKRSAYKEIRKSKRRHLRNVNVISDGKTAVRRFNLLLAEKKFDEARRFLGNVSSKLMKAAQKGVMDKKTASRKISRLSSNLAKAASGKK